MSFIHYCSNIQNSFTAPKIPCTPAIHPIYLFIFYMKKTCCFSFFWLHRVLVVAHGLFCCSMWDLVPLTRDRTHIPCIGRQTVNHRTTREIPSPSSWLVLRLSQFWPVRAISSWLLFLLIQSTFFLPLFFFFFIISLLSGIRCSRLILYFSCPSPEISHLSKGPRLLLVGYSI